MREDIVGLGIGGQMNIRYSNFDETETFFQGADDKERVANIMESFV